MKHSVFIHADENGLQVTVNRYVDGESVPTFDFQTDEGASLFAKILTQTLFAFTCLPPTSLYRDEVSWLVSNSSPSNSSDDGINEHLHPGSTE